MIAVREAEDMGFFDFLFKKEERVGGSYSSEKNNVIETQVALEDIEGDFLMVIDDVFSITGRGIIVTGTIASGMIKVGDTVKLKNIASDSVRVVTVAGIEMFRRVLDSATEGENVGLLLRGVTRDEVNAGDTLFQGNMVI